MKLFNRLYFLVFLFFCTGKINAQQASVNAVTDAQQITIGDQVRYFIEAKQPPGTRLEWAVIPDTFNTLEVVEKGKIDTITQNGIVTYKQRMLITGFDSGSFRIPSFSFSVIPDNAAPYTIRTDSFQLLVQTVPVDTTQPFKGIKDIVEVKSSWQDYLWWFIGGILLLLLALFAIRYFSKNRKTTIPAAIPKAPAETPQQKALRKLDELEKQQLWQSDKVKEYYIQLTDILRGYIEERFHTPAMELTTDELLQKATAHREMRLQYDQLASVLYTADMTKFAKAKPMPPEHISSMELSRQFILQTKPVVSPDTKT